MRIDSTSLPLKRPDCVATIGAFDGVHKGHQYILEQVKDRARSYGVKSLVITFDKLPQQFLEHYHFKNKWPSRKSFRGYIIDNQTKFLLMDRQGIDYVWFLKTNKKLLELSGQDFINYIGRYFSIKEIVVGDDFRFGYAGQESIAALKTIAEGVGFHLRVLKKRKKSKRIISSSLIRDNIAGGKLPAAEALLGRKYCVQGLVSRGKKMGTKLGFPTANIILQDYVSPADGIYAAYVIVEDDIYLGAVFVAAINQKKRLTLVEAHIIGFNRNILGAKISVAFIKMMRKKRLFNAFGQLQQAIGQDVDQISSKYSIPPFDRTQPIVA